jgi:hypothetical protein
MNNIINKIFSRPELKEQPPVLIDIGASGSLHTKWKKIAKYSWCIAFDADQRDFQFVEDEEGKFKKLFIYNCIVSDEDSYGSKYFLTKSPYCSSMLEPENEKLKPFVFSHLFDVEKEVILKTKSLCSVLKELSIPRIDWFKTDSQGIDLRLFKSLTPEMQKQVLVAEFEPGIISAYKGEDMLYQILEYFQSSYFWLADINIKEVPRIPHDLLQEIFKTDLLLKLAKESIHKVPGWGEMIFFNDFQINNLFTLREYLLGWIFATIENQHPFALVISRKGAELYKDGIFKEMEKKSISVMKKDILKLRFLPSVIEKFKKLLF